MAPHKLKRRALAKIYNMTKAVGAIIVPMVSVIPAIAIEKTAFDVSFKEDVMLTSWHKTTINFEKSNDLSCIITSETVHSLREFAKDFKNKVKTPHMVTFVYNIQGLVVQEIPTFCELW